MPCKKMLLTAALCAALGLLAPTGLKADTVTTQELPQLLEKALQEHPEIVLDVLRRHSESVLDIAQQGSNLRRKRNLEAQWRQDMKTPKKVALEERPVLGDARAKVRIVAFSDFTCHFCRQASQVLDGLIAQYGKDVCLVFKHLPMDEKGISAQASRYFIAIAMQDEAKAWKFYRTMFEQRDALVAEGEDFLKKTATDLDVDMKRLNRDIRSKKVTTILTEDAQDAQRLGVEGTPHFLVNDLVLRGALPADLFRAAIEMARKQPEK
ncbi:MAG: thioredoxin domain-containing protein [Desulfovibrionaceae bacterium]|nr:thioredoxin domain-containing protein [Desulfovibrionaceae bacterium]